jgi:hypothetical protein
VPWPVAEASGAHLNFHNVVDIMVEIVHGWLSRVIAPFPVHDELVLIHTRGQQLNDGKIVACLLERCADSPVVKGALYLHMAAAKAPCTRPHLQILQVHIHNNVNNKQWLQSSTVLQYVLLILMYIIYLRGSGGVPYLGAIN